MIDTKHASQASDPAGTGLDPAGDGQMWLDGEWRACLRRASMDAFEDVMADRAGRCLRVLADRENWHVRLSDSRGMFLKKHRIRTWHGRFTVKPGKTAGSVEARNVGRLAARGVDVMRLVAYGEKLHADGTLESFVISEELQGYVPLEQFVRERFPPRELHRTTSSDGDMRELIRRVAATVRRFHEAGFNHRDLYCCHLFVREPSPGRFDIRLIDLQRVQHRSRFRRRWLVKDLAQLAWSAPRERIKCTHKLAFMRHYLGVEKLRPVDKRLIRRILAKQQVMQRRLGIEP